MEYKVVNQFLSGDEAVRKKQLQQIAEELLKRYLQEEAES